MTARPWRASLTTLALALGGCSVNLAGLTPFPCAADGTCPDPLACTAHGCQAVEVGTPCSSDQVCEKGTPKGLRCRGGVCADTCNTTCPKGQRCSILGSSTSSNKACLLECDTPGGLCRGGARCILDPVLGVLLCSGATPPSACVSSGWPSSCTSCGPERLVTICADGRSCPSGAFCRPGGCGCLPMEGQSCAGTTCSGTSCTGVNFVCLTSSNVIYPGWYCAIPQQLGGTCHCRSSNSSGSSPRQIPCGTTQDCESVCGLGCTVASADACARGDAKWKAKCGLVASPIGASPQARCLPLQGQGSRGGPCSVQATPGGGALDGGALDGGALDGGMLDGGVPGDRVLLGGDDCGAGLVCHGAPGGRRCRQTCASDSTCQSGERCVRAAAVFPVYGICLKPDCEPTCAEGSSCTLEATVEGGWVNLCRPDGQADAGEQCGVSADCQANHACVGGSCRQPCAPGAACAAAGTCQAVLGADSGICPRAGL